MTPGNLCSKLVHNWAIWPGLGKSAHVLKVADGISSKLWEGTLEIGGEPIDHLCAPALPRLVGENVATDFPIMKNQLSVRSEGGFDLRSANALFDAGEEASVTLCNRLLHNWRWRRFPPGAHASRSFVTLLPILVSRATQCTHLA